jgi:monoamine oxidase
MGDVLIIGAGAAGLAAAEALAREKVTVTLLEARERIGGRILNVMDSGGHLPIELGAEFVHGAKNEVWEIIRDAGLETQELSDKHWLVCDGTTKAAGQSWNELEKILSRIDLHAPDRDFRSYLHGIPGLSSTTKAFAVDYVEGFHAADSSIVGIHSLARAEAAAEADEATRQFRLAKGYGAMLDWFWGRMKALSVEILHDRVVESIRWEPGSVEVEAKRGARREYFKAPRVLVTLPLGVLKEREEGVSFIPRIPKKEAAIKALAMGMVIKIVLQFQMRFWPNEDFGFIHVLEGMFPTWWSDQRGLVLTGWVGGPRACQLSKESPEAVLAEALRALAGIFKAEPKRVQELLTGVYRHDWIHDPFSLGAYSYSPVATDGMAEQLAAPVNDTLFFAGEATDSRGEQGTVHAALASGKRAAKEILRATRKVVLV